MTAKRYLVRLYEHRTRRLEREVNLDPKDDAILRSTLEDLVKAKVGHLRVDLSRWSIRVHNLGGGMVRARCWVSKTGATVVKR